MPKYSYIRIYADAEGESHCEDVVGDMVSTDFAPPAAPTHIGGDRSATQAMFLSVPAGWDGDRHVAPARQFMVILKGQVTMQIADGEIRTFNPGDVLL
jgi:quercetin dioxygenase-like cupin family protein